MTRMRLLTKRLTVVAAIVACCMQAMGAAISSDLIGEGKWVTLKTDNGYYFYAIEEDGQAKLGQTASAPNEQNYAQYCWQIEGNATEGYTFRCLQYENREKGKMYITNPATLGTNSQEVVLSTQGSRYLYTDKRQLQLAANQNLYLAFYSSSYRTIRLHNSEDYVGSRMTIALMEEWQVESLTDGGAILLDGGARYNNTEFRHGSSIHSSNVSTIQALAVSGYGTPSIAVENSTHTITLTYSSTQSGTVTKQAPTDGENAATGTNGTIWLMNASDYITNTSGAFTNVPAGKAWQIEAVVENVSQSQTDPSFNQWGSTILASTADPFNTQYWNNFQLYQHSPTHNSPNTLNFKASKANGYDHIIAQNASVKGKNYKVIVRYNGEYVYVIRTIMLDANLQETEAVYDNVWVSSRKQNEINQLSCALPTGINLKSLRISIAEEANLLEGFEYALINTGAERYLTGASTDNHSLMAADASKYTLEWTGNEDLTYTETDGALHKSFYIKLLSGSAAGYLTADGNTTTDKAQAQTYVFTTNGQIAPITAKNTISGEWTLDGKNVWEWDFFANFYVEVSGNRNGGLRYQKGNAEQTAQGGSYLELPASVRVEQLANSSQPGYMAMISKEEVSILVKYTEMGNTFFHIGPKNEQANLYYWDGTRLVSYSTTNSKSGVVTEWGEQGNCALYTIEQATAIPVKMSQNTVGTDADNRYYGSIYCPNAITLPDGVSAYRLDRTDADRYILKDIISTELPANTAAILVCDYDASGSWTLKPTDNSASSENNLLQGSVLAQPNSYRTGESSNCYVLSGKYGIGFYPYTGDKVPAFKAYYTSESLSPERFVFLFSEEESTTTGCEETATLPESDGKYYDVLGRAVAQPQRGHIYICNGRKLIY